MGAVTTQECSSLHAIGPFQSFVQLETHTLPQKLSSHFKLCAHFHTWVWSKDWLNYTPTCVHQKDTASL